jgi:hypothetical protein
MLVNKVCIPESSVGQYRMKKIELNAKTASTKTINKFISILPIIVVSFNSIVAQEISLIRWKENFPSHFTKVSKDSIGLLIYKPCDGSTPKVDMDSNYITLQGQLESDRLRITKIRRIRKTEYQLLCVDSHDDSPEIASELNVHLVLVDKKNMVWRIYAEVIGFEFYMPPDDVAVYMRQVDNPCEDRKIAEKKFLEIKY